MSGSRRIRGSARVLAGILVVALLSVPVTTAAAQEVGRTLDLRVLVLTSGVENDPGLDLMIETMDALSIPFDVMDTSTTDLTEDMLFDGDHGFYNGVVLTDAELFVPPDTSGFTDPEWRILHDYERRFGVAESVVSGSPSEVSRELDYGLDEVRAEPAVTGRWVGPAGASAFAYLNTDRPFEVTAFTVVTRPTGSGPQVTPLLVDSENPDDLLISRLDYADGRRVLFSGIASATFLLHGRALAYEFVRFATGGLHLGSHRQYLSVHVDDLFLSSPLWDSELKASNFDTLYRNQPGDLPNVAASQRRLEERFDTLGSLRWELAFNAAGSPLVGDGSLAMFADATVSAALPERRYGESGLLRSGPDHAMLLRFEARPPDTDAGTVLRLARVDGGPVAGTVCPLIEPFDELNVTWSMAGDGVPWTDGRPAVAPEQCLPFDLASSTDPIEIRTLIDWWASGAENHGVVVELASGSVSAPSREGGSGPVLYHGTAPALPDALTLEALELGDQLAYLNHTFTHRDLDASNGTGDAEAFFELSRNLIAWQDLDFPGYRENLDTLVTGQHSGLSEDQGTFADTSDDITFPEGANPALLDAMEELGIRFTASDQSRPGQNEDRFIPGRDIAILPRWPANVFFDVRTPDQLTAEYNFLFNESYIDQGLDPCETPGAICEPRAYDEIVQAEADRALLRLLSGRRWPHYFHITNIGDYDGQGSTLLGDWIAALVDRYEDYMALPIDSPLYHRIADMTEAGIAVADGEVEAVLDIESGSIGLTSATPIQLEITGVEGGTAHGGQLVRLVALGPERTVELTASTPIARNVEPATVAVLDAARPDAIVDPGRRLLAAGGPTPTEVLVAVEADELPDDGGLALTLHDVRTGAATVVLEVCTVAGPWTPTEATWRQSGAGAPWDGEGADAGTCVVAVLDAGRSAAIDVTGLLPSPDLANGLVLRVADGWVGFDGLSGAMPPVLVATVPR
ncbi:MAG: hypothetical protein AAF480_01345 [Actinomycetota bacterium]